MVQTRSQTRSQPRPKVQEKEEFEGYSTEKYTPKGYNIEGYNIEDLDKNNLVQLLYNSFKFLLHKFY